MAAHALATDIGRGGGERRVVWAPQPGPQTALLACSVFEVFYGGARGGGKTDGMLGDWASHAAEYGAHAIGLMVRRTLKQLRDTIERSRAIYGPLGWLFNDETKTWRAQNGARLTMAYLERDTDAENYQGHSYTRVYVEELGNFPSQSPVMKLMATLRSGAGVPVGFRATGNPGGPGHGWVKARYIDPAPRGWQIIATTYTNPFDGSEARRERVYIPARVTDNAYLGSDYVTTLQMSGSPELVRAWLEGDWNVIAGAYFPEFSAEKHVVAPRALPEEWLRFRAMDWGSAHPFSVGWYAVSDGGLQTFPRGALVKYREWYGASAPNEGLKMDASEVGRGIALRDGAERISYGVLDPSAFRADGGPSIAERINTALSLAARTSSRREGIGTFHHADNTRVARRGALSGWDQLRARLNGDDGRPMIYFFSTCVDTIRTLPAVQHDVARPEDVDTTGEDHAADETRYAAMSRPFVRTVVAPAPPVYDYAATATGGMRSNLSIREIIERQRRRRIGDEEQEP